MPNRRRLRGAFLAAALGLLPFSAESVQAAGFIDAIGSLFGADPEPPRYYRQPPHSPYYGSGSPLDVTVRARRQRPKKERPVVRRQKPTAVAAVPRVKIDPAKNPDWYLDDPTLRRGDIVVLKGEVLVYQGDGRSPRAREDFTALAASGLSSSERDKIAAMARLRPGSSKAANAQQKTATVAAE